ncbi:MAG: hypothetical protein A2564_03160 [Candidatus Wildermuthbacteria bacterium RIFOXYD1_FULL_50_12]|nr:MAG: hypothetical protein A2564_03160 [Candidatus Wildermuthbacteria bacterium RIFOXYD1_FULL_50_12]
MWTQEKDGLAAITTSRLLWNEDSRTWRRMILKIGVQAETRAEPQKVKTACLARREFCRFLKIPVFLQAMQ